MHSSVNNEENVLVAVVQIFRHGHRNPDLIYPKDPYDKNTYWPLAIGDLTNRGKKGIFDLGQHTRERYKDFLPQIYPSKNLRIYSTDSERCIISAHLYAAGLYPPIKEEIWNEDLKWNPIPVHIVEKHVLRGFKLFCPTYAKEYRKIMDSFMEQFKKDPLSEYVSQHSGIELKRYEDFAYLYDTLAVQDSLKLKLPEWTKKVYPDYLKNAHLDIIDIVCWTEEMKKLYIGPLFYEIIQFFDKMLENPSSGPKLLAYCCHDVNIASILKTLEAYERHLPNYGSSIFFELRKKKGIPYVNVIYRQEEDVPVVIFGQSFDVKFEDFKNILRDFIVSKEEFYKECGE